MYYLHAYVDRFAHIPIYILYLLYITPLFSNNIVTFLYDKNLAICNWQRGIVSRHNCTMYTHRNQFILMLSSMFSPMQE